MSARPSLASSRSRASAAVGIARSAASAGRHARVCGRSRSDTRSPSGMRQKAPGAGTAPAFLSAAMPAAGPASALAQGVRAGGCVLDNLPLVPGRWVGTRGGARRCRACPARRRGPGPGHLPSCAPCWASRNVLDLPDVCSHGFFFFPLPQTLSFPFSFGFSLWPPFRCPPDPPPRGQGGGPDAAALLLFLSPRALPLGLPARMRRRAEVLPLPALPLVSGWCLERGSAAVP